MSDMNEKHGNFICPKCTQNVKEQVEKNRSVQHYMDLETGNAIHIGACPKVEKEEQNDKTNILQK